MKHGRAYCMCLLFFGRGAWRFARETVPWQCHLLLVPGLSETRARGLGHGENKVFQGVRDLPKRCSHCLQLLKGLTVQVYFTLLIRVRTRPASIPMWRSGGWIHVAYRAGGGVCTV